jgi:xanthine/CO dehydrogenase XdhC/CoxF family maturation factor
MKEIRSIIKAYSSIDLAVTKAALATVVRVEGSSYRRTGARMLVLDDGTYLGGISGGCLEGDALRKALRAISQNKPSIVTYDTTQEDDHQVGVGLGCNGIIDVLFTPLQPHDPFNPVEILETVSGTRKPVWLITITGSEAAPEALAKILVYENEEQFLQNFSLPSLASDVLEDIKECQQSERSAATTYGEENKTRVFIERLAPATRLLIFGSHYDTHPLARMANELGWEVTLITNLIKAGKDIFQYAQVIDRTQEDHITTDAYTAAVLMNHDLATDTRQLEKLLETGVAYIGLLGPRKRSLRMLETLPSKTSANGDGRIFAPAGLDIGALSPEEIALSIAAEIQGHFAGRLGQSLRLRPGSIHDHEHK